MPVLNCICCKKDYKVPKYRELSSKFCSRKCQNNLQHESIKKVCKCCNKEFFVSNSRANQIFCSIECRQHTKITAIERRRESRRLVSLKRGSASSKVVRKFAFANKDIKCEICNYSEYDFCLDVHHIDENPINNDLQNLAILCCMCHKKLHKKVIKFPVKNGD